jgi:3-phosphoshikimate 1-carboxyvinyltransferase
MSINPVNCLSPIVYSLPVASAQIKGAILLAGLFLDEVTAVIEPQETRNHTELLFGLPTSEGPDGKKICSSSAYYPVPFEMIVPGDVSSAAFFIVLALLLPKSALRIENVSLNKTRTGYLHILKLMGGDITEENLRSEGGEPVGDILVRSSALRNVDISNELIANIIDEIPILTIAALFAEGDFTIRDVKELRYKESDRINAVCTNLRAAGIEVEEFDDGYAFRGMQSSFCRRAPEFLSFSDHRIAMAFSVLSLLLSTGGSIDALDSIGISNPSFFQNIETISG